ncbi:Putative trypsin-like serine protease [Roseobacter sp. SK209-2-6]|uniref:trypsin-like peptidase domain-containing protein n=1 Tax=Roseobacter sp. SK209-2-6 TaxID=388739 RepID=UPI0000F3C294|nr:trypsin-like peptidase domain-containing protein [Roseobacter sp. SK209-2-6]EBA15342.1 Putative trypsin-like serine protease [Roseobacter sp. SK209-2-6]
MITRTPSRSAVFGLSTAVAATVLLSLAPAPALAVPGSGGYADLVESVSPAVVYVEVTGKRTTKAEAGAKPHKQMSPGEDFFEEFRRRFGHQMPGQGQMRPTKGAGSGFVISEEGLIVTNHHVVKGADTVEVTLSDGSKHAAEVIGADPLTDIALLQIEAGKDLPVVEFGSSGDLRVGEEVIAMGSPFGLSGTVTSGIVSATSRNINAGPFDDFIQTDAAINRGNSGGPLFNGEGDVVGVNTAIFSPDGGSVGIGFAVPSDLVRDIVADLQDDGRIDRGWLGVQIKPLSEDAANVLGLEAGKGVVIESVVADSPAEAAGLKPGDVVVSFGGAEVGELRDLTKAVAMNNPEEETKMEILRRGKTLEIDVTLGNRADQEA